MNYQEILKVLEDKLGSVSTFAYGDFIDEELGLGPTKEVATHGGESQGEEWYSVRHFIKYDIYIRVDGTYTSHNGTDFYDGWNSCSEVKPRREMVTVWR